MKNELLHWCPACQVGPGEPCTQPTDTGRTAVAWFHSSRSNKAVKWWVLQANGYPDTFGDYSACEDRREVQEQLIDLGYLENPAVTVFSGARRPWTETDPYPDWVVSRGPRGGVNWDRA